VAAHFPASRQLPHLLTLELDKLFHPGVDSSAEAPHGKCSAAAPESSCLVSCCPALQTLSMYDLQHSADPLATLQGLSGLHNLTLSPSCAAEGFEGVCQLTGLRRLNLYENCRPTVGLLLRLTQLRQLTHLTYGWLPNGYRRTQLLHFPNDQLGLGNALDACRARAVARHRAHRVA
jgi:hypothetical protein